MQSGWWLVIVKIIKVLNNYCIYWYKLMAFWFCVFNNCNILINYEWNEQEADFSNTKISNKIIINLVTIAKFKCMWYINMSPTQLLHKHPL